MGQVPARAVGEEHKMSTSDDEFGRKLLDIPFEHSPNNYTLILTDIVRDKLKAIIDTENLQEHIYRLEISARGILLFEGYDGLEFGTISKAFALPHDFVRKYIKDDMCVISKDW